jgi:photosystem II stability/assembly factor-like uncharacterized protein
MRSIRCWCDAKAVTRCALLVLAKLVVVAAPASPQGNLNPRGDAVVNRSTHPLLGNFRARSIGPASMGGRIDDIEVYEKDPRIVWVGYATGGVFRSLNAGTTFEPIFEEFATASIGDIAMDQSNPDIVYVGTGEANNRQTSSFGDGIYRTTDGGRTFTHLGLRETQTIARIVLDPRDSRVVYVAAPGHLFGPNPERGLFKSNDGGESWTRSLYIDENTGVTDVAIDPQNPDVLYAASYQRRRTGCCFNGGGPGSGLWKTEDAGTTWARLSGGGLPPGTWGRIAVAVARSNPEVLYAQIETDGEGAEEVAEVPDGYDWCNNVDAEVDPAEGHPEPSAARSGLYRSEDGGRTWTLVSNCNGRPMYFSNIRVDPTDDQVLYVSNVRAARSLDGGRTFARIDEGRGLGNQTVDQHAYWIDPNEPHHVLRGSDAGLAESWDRGATWEYVRTMATGLAYWVSADMHRPYNVLFGLQDNDSWMGPSATRAQTGIRDHAWFRLSGGDGFQTAVDPTDRFTVFSESQNGNTRRTDLRTGTGQSIRPTPPQAPEGAEPPPAGSCVDGRIVSGDDRPGGRGRGSTASNVINGQPGETYRFNWNTPFVLSPHDPSTIWLGGNRLFRSADRGDVWTASVDLTRQIDRCRVTVMGVAGSVQQLSKNDGVTSYSTIISVSESPVARGVVWAGTDDGNLQVSRDDGATFTEVGRNITGLPADALSGDNPYWISRIDASHFDAGTAYVAIDGHRSDDLRPYIFRTVDYGQTWTRISDGLPGLGNVRTVREDPKNPNLLYAGTEFGLYLSLDGGGNWERFMNGYPTVRTDEVLVHPRDGDLIVASHGRSLWIVDDITPLQQWTPAVAQADATLFDVRPAVAYRTDARLNVATGGEKQFEGENPAPGTAIHFYVNDRVTGEATVAVTEVGGRTLCESSMPVSPGQLHRVQWTLVAPGLASNAGRAGGGRGAATSVDGGGEGEVEVGRCGGQAEGGRGGGAPRAAPGSYLVKLTVGGRVYTKAVQVLEDIWMGL